MKILTTWLRRYLPTLAVADPQLAEDLTLRGIAVEGVHDLGSAPDGTPRGSLFEMDITTNRVDAMNHFGIGREAAAIYHLPLAPLTAALPTPAPASTPFPVRIDPAVQHLCGRFTARVLRNVRVGESTGDVRAFFDLLGQRPISSAVDASNFTLFGMGHPTHAFDLDRIAGELLVRFAHPGERLQLLDGSERTLEPDDLVIADRSRALSLAGVMGGMSSSITASTRNILVEAAWFDPASVRRSARRHGLHTDASHRFERGADFDAAPLANDLVSALILASGGGTLEGELIDLAIPEVAARTSRRPPVSLSVRELQQHLGATVDDRDGRSALTPHLVSEVLSALGCTLTPQDHTTGSNPSRSTLHTRQDTAPGEHFSVTLPPWRLDLERPIDLIEEVARIFGYNRFQNTLPTALPVREHPTARAEERIRARLLALGFSEAISSTFANTADSETFAPSDTPDTPHIPDTSATSTPTGNERTPPAGIHVPLENPLSDEVANLRPSLLPGMLTMLGLNLNRGVTTVRLFEQGNIFSGSASTPGSPSLPSSPSHPGGTAASSIASAAGGPAPASPAALATVTEDLRLTLGLTAATTPATPLHTAADAPIFELKAAVESLASLFDHPALTFTTTHTPAWLEPGRSAIALLTSTPGAGAPTAETPIAVFGELAASEAAARKLRQPVFLADIDLARLLKLPLRQPIARELSRFQAVSRDFSFVFPDRTAWHTITAAIDRVALPDLRSVTPVEIFRDPRGKAVPVGSYSLLIRTVFQSPARTLTDEELTAASDRLIATLTALGGIHRG